MAAWETTLMTLGRGHATELVRTAYLLGGDREVAERRVERALARVAADPTERERAAAAAPAAARSVLRRALLADVPRRTRGVSEPVPEPGVDATTLLSVLPPAVRACAVLHAWVGLSVPEVAAETALPVDTVTRYLRDGRALVAAQLPEWEGTGRDDDGMRALLERSLAEGGLDGADAGAHVDVVRAVALVRSRRRRRTVATAGAVAASLALVAVVLGQVGVLGSGGTRADGATPPAVADTPADQDPETTAPDDDAPTADAEPVDLEETAEAEEPTDPGGQDSQAADALAGAVPFRAACGDAWDGAEPQTGMGLEVLDQLRTPRDADDDVAGRVVLTSDVEMTDVPLAPYLLVLADGVRVSADAGEAPTTPLAAGQGSEQPFSSDLTGCDGEPLAAGDYEAVLLVLATTADGAVVVAAADPASLTIR